MRVGKETKEFSEAFNHIYLGLQTVTPELVAWRFDCDSNREVRCILLYQGDHPVNSDEDLKDCYPARADIMGDSVGTAIFDTVRAWHERVM